MSDVIRPSDDGPIRQHGATGSAHADFCTPVSVEIINGHVVLVADGNSRRTRFDVVLISAVVAHVHLPEKSSVAAVGLQKLFGSDGGGHPVHDKIIFAVTVNIANPTEFHVVRSRRTAGSVQRYGKVLLHR